MGKAQTASTKSNEVTFPVPVANMKLGSAGIDGQPRKMT